MSIIGIAGDTSSQRLAPSKKRAENETSAEHLETQAREQALLAELDAVVAAMAQLPAADVSYRDARASAVQRPLVRRTVEITQKVE